MSYLLISIIFGVVLFLLIGVVEELALGNRGKQDSITKHFNFLRGIKTDRNIKRKVGNENKWRIHKISNIYYLYSIIISLCIFIISIIVFKSLMLAFLLSLIGIFYPKININNSNRKRKDKLILQFRDALNSIIGSLKAGLSINSSIIKCTADLQRLYSSHKEKYMLDEFKKISDDLSIGISVDDALKKFRERLDLEEVDDFVNSVIIIRQKGGNMLEIMENVTKMISEKIVIKNEIKVATAGKIFEAKMLTIVPIFLIISLSIFSPGYMEPLYSTVLGKILIIIGFVFLIINYFVGKKITDINV